MAKARQTRRNAKKAPNGNGCPRHGDRRIAAERNSGDGKGVAEQAIAAEVEKDVN